MLSKTIEADGILLDGSLSHRTNGCEQAYRGMGVARSFIGINSLFLTSKFKLYQSNTARGMQDAAPTYIKYTQMTANELFRACNCI